MCVVMSIGLVVWSFIGIEVIGFGSMIVLIKGRFNYYDS